MKRCSTSLIMSEIQIKSTVRYHLTLVRMPVIKRSKTVNVGEDVEKRKLSYTVGGNMAYQWEMSVSLSKFE